MRKVIRIIAGGANTGFFVFPASGAANVIPFICHFVEA